MMKALLERHRAAETAQAAAEVPARDSIAPTSSTEAVRQLREIKDGEYRRYLAAHAMRALRDGEDEPPKSSDLRKVVKMVGVIGRWKKRRRPELLKMVAPPRDPELPDHLQSPMPPHSRWFFDARANELFNVFSGASNPVEDFYLTPMNEMWRSQKSGVYGLRYEKYPNPDAIAVPQDGEGLYYRPNKKMLKTVDGARPPRRPGVVTLQHVKAVAARAVAQFFPMVHAHAHFFDEWPKLDDVLGSVLEYFYHYFELRRLEEAMVQLECRLYNSGQMEERRRRMDECMAEVGTVYSGYLLGAGLPFHHLNRGASYSSAGPTERQMFEALYAYIAQCVWIAFRRPNVTVIVREIGRLFRTESFDLARRAAQPPMDEAKATPSATRRVGQGKSRQDMGRRGVSGKKASEAPHSGHAGSGKAKGATSASSRQPGSDGDKSSQQPQSPSSANPAKSGMKQSANNPRPSASRSQGPDSEVRAPASNVKFSSRGSNSRVPLPTDSPTSGDPQAGDSSSSPSPDDSPVPSSEPGADTGNRASLATGASAAGSRPSTAASAEKPPPPAAFPAHVSMKKVYGLYTGPQPPKKAIFGLLHANSPLLRQSLAYQQRQVGAPSEPSRLRADRNRIGILGTPLQNYDDVLAGIDYEREEKEEQLKFLGPRSTKAGVSRVAGVIPYLLLPSKFFSPDA